MSGGFLLKLLPVGHQPRQDRFRRQPAVANRRHQLVGLAAAVLLRQLRELGRLLQRLRVEPESSRVLLEQLPPEIDAPGFLLLLDEVADLLARPRRDHEVEPVAAGRVAGLRHDLDDVAVLQAGAERHHLAVHARADAAVADVGVNGVGEVERRRAAWERLDLAFRREDVDLLRVEVDLQVVDELLRIADLLLPLEQLAHPLEVPLVALVADAAFLVLPVRGDAFLGLLVHLLGPDLHLERRALLADDRRVQRLVAVGPRHRDEVLDAARHRRPGVVDDAERGVAVLHRPGDDPQRDEVVDLLELDLLFLQLLPDAVEALDAAVDLRRTGPAPRSASPQCVCFELVDQAFRARGACASTRPRSDS